MKGSAGANGNGGATTTKLMRPFEWIRARQSRFGLIGRADRFDLDVSLIGRQRFVVAGFFWKTAISQPRQDSSRYYTESRFFQRLKALDLTNVPEQRTLFLHWQAT